MFTSDYTQFFKDLAANNNRDWFQENKKRYEKSVKDPFKSFVQALIEMVARHEGEMEIQPKDCIFRINRDIRFSKDKTPYKLNCSAIVSKGGKKDKTYPGLYVEASPEHVRVYGGVYMPDKDQTFDIREKILNKTSDFKSLYEDKKFKKYFGEIRGDKNKRTDKSFMEHSETEPLIMNKQWYWFSEMDPKILESDKLITEIESRYVAMKPLMDYFREVI
jgi:uncharacterized protein (TIGR02453 family)